MSKYTTGEAAKLCSITVRTVQYYDTKGLLHPSEITEGGRRLYSEEDIKTLQLICMLKTLGLSLCSIKGILESDNSGNVLTLLLEEQAKQINEELQEKKEQLNMIQLVKKDINNRGTTSLNSINDIETMVKSKKKLKKTYIKIAILAGIMALLEYGTILYWIFTGIFIPFIIGMVAVIVLGCVVTKYLYKEVAYICPQCNKKFKPKFSAFFVARHTPKTRKLVCPECGEKNWCVETSAD